VIDTLAEELSAIRERFPDAELVGNPDGGYRLTLPHIRLPDGWSVVETSVVIIMPAGYPAVRPDCFYTDQNVRLASGAEPANSSIQPLDEKPRRWYSWHVSTWDSLHDDLAKYVRFVERRLSDPR
jgi:hypothetical protein